MLHQTPGNLEADRESFERNQTISIQKAINTVECATKEKHIRTAILGTYQDRGAGMFWHVVQKLPFTTQPIVAWKLSHVFHKVIRDGHPMVLKDSIRHKQQLLDIGRNWNYDSHVYGKLVGAYMKCLALRLGFHKKYANFPGNLTISAEDLDAVDEGDINSCFELSVDLLDNLECLIDLERKVFATFDSSRAYSQTAAGKCRLAPCILIILDTSQLYDLTVKTLFKLHGCLPSDALSGHRIRFEDSFNNLKSFYEICSNLQYFKKLIQIPDLPDSPPDFLVKSAESFELGPVQVVEEEEEREPSPEPVVYDLIDTNPVDDNIDPIFMMASAFQRDSRDTEIEVLRAEIARLQAEIEAMRAEFNQEIHVLLEEIRLLHRDMHDANASASNASNEASRLQQIAEEKEAAKSKSSMAAQKLFQNAEKKAQDCEEMYKKMKDKHMTLMKEHADLLRKNVESQRAVDAIRKNIGDGETENAKLKQELETLKTQLETFLASQKERERRQNEERERLIAVATAQARDVILQAINSLDDVNSTRTCSAESLMHIVTKAKEVLARLELKIADHKRTLEIGGLIQALSLFGHSMAQALENGGATCNMAPDGQGQKLKDSCRKCGDVTLSFLDRLKESNYSKNVKLGLEEVLRSARDLLPKMSDVKGGDLHDLVEQEMATTAQAVEQAAERIEALLNEARNRDSGVNLEVNERILDSCTELMKLIKILITAATELQREIVAQGRGSSTKKEFYMSNSRWTEGLISAAKAVGWGATMLTDSADVVIQGTGKFEELVVWSHEISASTAQLVAASRVKASNCSTKLIPLENASRNVNGATAKVVTATKAGRQQLDDARNFLSDVTNIASLIQVKRKEMDSQVKVLELEQALQQERLKLGTLRKKHYELAELKEDDVSTNKSTKTGKKDNVKPSQSAMPQKPALPIKPVLSLKPKAPPKPTLAPKPNFKKGLK